MTVFSGLWLCQPLLILGHSALNLNILHKSKLINQQNAGLDTHYFSHIKQVGEGEKKKKPQKQNQGKHITVGFLCAKCSQQLGSVFFCVKKRFWCVTAVCHSHRTLPEFMSTHSELQSRLVHSSLPAKYPTDQTSPSQMF